jgi:zinc protease
MRGSAKHTRQQIQDEIDRLKARLNVFGGTTNAGVQIETTRENLPAVLRLAAEILREPAFPGDEFEQLRQQRLAGLEQSKSEPQVLGQLELQRHLRPWPKGDVRYVPTIDESIADVKAVTLDDAKKFYTDFYGASNGEFSVVGDFDAAEISKLATELFGSWKSPRPFTRVGDTYRDIAPINKSLETPDKANALFAAGINLNVQDTDPDYAALVLGNYMLGGGFLNSRLATRVRQKDGLSYGISSQFQASSLDRTGIFAITAIYAPQNAERLEAAVREELTRALADGFTEDEVKAAKAGWLQSNQVTRAQDPSLANRLNTVSYINRTLSWDAELESIIASLTPAEIKAALVKHIAMAKISFVKAGDFAKAAAATK